MVSSLQIFQPKFYVHLSDNVLHAPPISSSMTCSKECDRTFKILVYTLEGYIPPFTVLCILQQSVWEWFVSHCYTPLLLQVYENCFWEQLKWYDAWLIQWSFCLVLPMYYFHSTFCPLRVSPVTTSLAVAVRKQCCVITKLCSSGSFWNFILKRFSFCFFFSVLMFCRMVYRNIQSLCISGSHNWYSFYAWEYNENMEVPSSLIDM
jgi:hypothetical protein